MKTNLLKKLRNNAKGMVRLDLRLRDDETPFAIQIKADGVEWVTIHRFMQLENAKAKLDLFRREAFYSLVEERWNSRELVMKRERINVL